MFGRKKSRYFLEYFAILAVIISFVGCHNRSQSDAGAGAPGAASASDQPQTADSSQPANSANDSATESKSAPAKSSAFGGLFSSTKPVTVPAATSLHVVLDQTLSSARSRPGDQFEASLAEPVVLEGVTVIPRHSHVRGRVVDADASGRLKGVAKLEITLASVEVNGKWYDLDTNSSTHVGQNHNKRNGVLMGGGAGLGALVGGLAGGGKGALIGAAAGAGAGTAGAAATGKKDISFPAETPLTFRLKSSITIPVKS
ncbi:MAG: hypothetical protein ACRD4K_08010 [Candidatus Acidiferrales bacterium]